MLQVTKLDAGRVAVESETIRLVVEPGLGGKIRSFFSKRSGQEYFFQDPRTELPATGYSLHDISGMDECFPTVADCKSEVGTLAGEALGDHGMLWDRPWDFESKANGFAMRCTVPKLSTTFTREAHFAGEAAVEFQYTIEYRGQEPLEFIYSNHPLLRATPATKFLFSKNIERIFNYLAIGLEGYVDGEHYPWPPVGMPGLEQPFSTAPKSVLKGFARVLGSVRSGVCHTPEEMLEIAYDDPQLQYLGILILQGIESEDSNFRDSIVLALEATTGMGDDLPTCRRTASVRTLTPGETLHFRTTFRLCPPGPLPAGPIGLLAR